MWCHNIIDFSIYFEDSSFLASASPPHGPSIYAETTNLLLQHIEKLDIMIGVF